MVCIANIEQCIHQGNDDEWVIESAKTASIYGQAAFTVEFVDQTSLVDAAEASRGMFLKTEHGDHDINEDFSPPYNPLSPESVYQWLETSGNFPSRPNGELDTRGWAFQERLLSRRIVSITKEGIFWDCLRLSACDWRPLGFLGDFSPRFRDSDERKIKGALLNDRAHAQEEHGLSATVRKKYYLLWRRLLQSYTGRAFTNPPDRPMAIQGVLHRLRFLLQEEDHHFGVWEGDVLRSLIWFVETEGENARVLLSEPFVKVPSWLWASVDAPIQYRLWHPFWRYRDRDIEVVAPPHTVVENISAKASSPGQLSGCSGEVILRGPLATLETTKVRRLPGCKLMFDPRPEAWYSSQVSPDFIRDTSRLKRYYEVDCLQDLVIMKILEGGYSEDQMAQYCLILQPCLPPKPIPRQKRVKPHLGSLPSSPSYYRRLGLLVVDKTLDNFCADDRDICKDDGCLLEKKQKRDGRLVSRRCLGRITTIAIV